jgi:hypothetical protein
MAEDQNEAGRKRALEQGKEIREKSMREYEERTTGAKPTPTQEENDRAAMGEHVVEKESDGSPEEGPTAGTQTRHSEARPGGDYQTRAAKPAQPAQPRPAQPRTE